MAINTDEEFIDSLSMEQAIAVGILKQTMTRMMGVIYETLTPEQKEYATKMGKQMREQGGGLFNVGE